MGVRRFCWTCLLLLSAAGLTDADAHARRTHYQDCEVCGLLLYRIEMALNLKQGQQAYRRHVELKKEGKSLSTKARKRWVKQKEQLLEQARHLEVYVQQLCEAEAKLFRELACGQIRSKEMKRSTIRNSGEPSIEKSGAADEECPTRLQERCESLISTRASDLAGAAMQGFNASHCSTLIESYCTRARALMLLGDGYAEKPAATGKMEL